MKLLALLFSGLFALIAYAQPFPSKPLRIVVPFPAGGTTDFAGVSIAVFVPLVITAATSGPAKDLKELVGYLQKDKNARYTYGSTGPGSFMHVMGEAISRETGIQMTHVPYKGAAPLKQEL